MAAKSDEAANKNGRLWALDQQFDQPMDVEADCIRTQNDESKPSTFVLLRLAFQSLGIVYGDLGTSPLYVFYNTFPNGIDDPEDVVGALSFIIYSLALIPLVKYLFIVSRATDNGQGGTFALYSLLCRHAKIRTIPNQDHTDERLRTYSTSTFHEKSFAATTKRWLERYSYTKNGLLILVIIGSSMLIGDGVVIPCISVVSALNGIKLSHHRMSQEVEMGVSVAILVALFWLQRFGTEKVSWLFAPILLVWFLSIGGIGIFNIVKYGTKALKAFSPVYMYRAFNGNHKDAWLSLGGVMLSIAGSEALFADISNFSISAIQIAFLVVVLPCLILSYSGQAAYLMKHSDRVGDAFYSSIPDSVYWAMMVIATAAAIVACQTTISATFSLVKQALALDCFPRVKVVHTSKRLSTDIYIPEINWILMVLCIAVTVGFKNQIHIGNASGTAVVVVTLVTTLLVTLIMILVWRCHWVFVILFAAFFFLIEGTYFASIILKVHEGGWVPLSIAACCFVAMYGWHYGRQKCYEFEIHGKVSMAWLVGLGPSLGLVRVPGIGLVYTKLVSGVPHIFSHFITNLPAIHSVVIFICIKYLPVCTVPQEERFLVRRIGPKEFHMFRCVARYGYSHPLVLLIN
ncbi:Putative potassium transporter 12 [Linum grandiflorum]